MDFNGLITSFPRELKLLLGAFTLVLSIGFYTGLVFIGETSTINPSGIEEQYLGNEADEDAVVMKFKKSKKQMLTLVHNHVLSMSIIFLLLGLILLVTKLNIRLKLFLIIEPFLSVVLTFGGLYLMWDGLLWIKYIVIISGSLMVFCFTTSILIIFKQLLFNKPSK
jgi:hypothetical protein